MLDWKAEGWLCLKESEWCVKDFPEMKDGRRKTGRYREEKEQMEGFLALIFCSSHCTGYNIQKGV